VAYNYTQAYNEKSDRDRTIIISNENDLMDSAIACLYLTIMTESPSPFPFNINRSVNGNIRSKFIHDQCMNINDYD